MKNAKKKTLSLIMAVFMITSLMAGMTISVGADTLYSGGSGTSTSPYQISTKADLEYLSANVGDVTVDTYFKMTNDIKLNDSAVSGPSTTATEWVPIGGGASNYSFTGQFNGGGYTIYNAYYNQADGSFSGGNTVKNNIGIFGKVEAGASVSNLNTVGGYIAAHRSVGGIVGKNWGSVINCVNGNTVLGTQSQGVGGVVGASWATTINSVDYIPVIDSCVNEGTVTSSYSTGAAGGIAGENEGSVLNCWNEGDVTSPGNAGGLVGSNKNFDPSQPHFNPGGTVYPYVVYAGIYNSYNVGDVDGNYAGGIAGYQVGTAANVYNYGDVTGTNAGEIFGELKVTDASQSNEYLYILDGTTAVGLTTSGTVSNVETFRKDDAGKLGLWEALIEWVDDNGSVYSKWDIDDYKNDGFPILVI